MAGVLYTVATPIGNLDDITSRALKTLDSADYILCEDTRVSSKLLSRFNISKKLIPYHKFNEKSQIDSVIKDLENGLNIALISDAGTPCVSDPGRILLNEIYKHNLKVSPVSGACAVSTFLSAVAKDDEDYAFCGFVPRTIKEQEKLFEKYENVDLIFYESPNRLTKTLENIASLRGNDAKVSIGRELTKLYEEIKFGKVSELVEYYKNNPPKGEIVVMLYKKAIAEEVQTDIKKHIKALQAKGFSTKDISVILSTIFDLNKNEIYKLVK